MEEPFEVDLRRYPGPDDLGDHISAMEVSSLGTVLCLDNLCKKRLFLKGTIWVPESSHPNAKLTFTS